MFPIEEQAVCVRNGLRPLVSLLSEFILEVLRSDLRRKTQAKYCFLAYFWAAFNVCGATVSLVTAGFAVVNAAPINPVSIPRSLPQCSMTCFDTVLELLEVCLTCHVPVLGQVVEPPFCVM